MRPPNFQVKRRERIQVNYGRVDKTKSSEFSPPANFLKNLIQTICFFSVAQRYSYEVSMIKFKNRMKKKIKALNLK
jgi:hypothetical protein